MQTLRELSEPYRQLSPRFFAASESGRVALVLRSPGARDAIAGGSEANLLFVDADAPTSPALELDDESADVVFVIDVLQSVTDYRRLCAEALRIARPGGFCFFRVPHQFLFERRFSLGSAFDKRNKRFYTPAALILEWEEAAAPLDYRLRALRDNDEGFDYSIGLTDRPKGAAAIEMLIEKISPPAWGDDIVQFGNRREDERRPHGDVSSRAGPAPVMAVKAHKASAASILVLKLDHRGDFLLARAAFARLRGAFPDADITLVCGEWNVVEAKASGFFDDVVAFSIFDEQANANRPDLYRKAGARLEKLLARRRFDLALDLRMNDDTRFLLDLVKADLRAGFPSECVKSGLDIVLPLYAPTDVERPARQAFNADTFAANVGEHRGVMVDLAGATKVSPGDCLVYGPYRSLEAGRLEFTLHLEAPQPHWIGYDACHRSGSELLTKGSVLAGSSATTFAVDVPDGVRDFEVRLIALDETVMPFRFFGASYVKRGKMTGAHQSEFMSLLVALVEERLLHSRSLHQVAE